MGCTAPLRLPNVVLTVGVCDGR